ncbi:MAG: AAA family ATPase [Gammaproteobacteria bacterium]|nr:AAA family ATPase [Gammaproteobacteria bacterium]
MAQSIQHEAPGPAYLDYFGMTHPPFDALPGPSPIFYSEQHSLLIAHLSNATEQSDRLLLICGAPGSGKTTLLNQYISGLDDDVWLATLDDNCTSATRFYCQVLEQLGFPEMTGGLHELRNITREFLVHRGKANHNVVLLIDNAHRLRPIIYEQIGWIADIKHRNHSVISLVLSGGPDLPGVLQSEAMKSISFRSRTDFTIRAFSSEETDNYITHRLKMAGDADAAQFSAEARSLIYSHSGGIPDLINMLADGALAEAHAGGVRVISEDLVHNVAKANKVSQNSCPSINRGRRKSDVQSRRTEIGEPEEPDDKITDLEEKLARSESECETIRSELALRDEQLSDLLEQAGQMDAAVKASLANQRKRDKENARLRRQITKIEEHAAEIPDFGTGKIGEIKQELYASIKSLKESQSEAAKYAQDLQKAKRAKQRVDRQLAKSKAKIEELDKWRKDLQESVRSLKNDLCQATESKEDCRMLTEKVAALEHDLKQKDERIKELVKKPEFFFQGETWAQPTLSKTNENPDHNCASDRADCDSGSKNSRRPISEFEVLRGTRKVLAMKVADNVSRIMIGRSEDCELRLDSNIVSRHHAMITFGSNGVRIQDLNSYNGTIVNSSKVSKRDLKPSDEIIIGEFLIRPTGSPGVR